MICRLLFVLLLSASFVQAADDAEAKGDDKPRQEQEKADESKPVKESDQDRAENSKPEKAEAKGQEMKAKKDPSDVPAEESEPKAGDAPAESGEPQGEADEAAPKANSGPKVISGMSILGNQEAPKSLVIVPWKSSELGDSLGIAPLLDDSKRPVDKEVFMRALSYYEIRSKKKP